MRGQRHASAAPYRRERPGTHCTGGWVGLRAGVDWCGKSRPTGIRSPDRPARRLSLYRLSYRAHKQNLTLIIVSVAYCESPGKCMKYVSFPWLLMVAAHDRKMLVPARHSSGNDWLWKNSACAEDSVASIRSDHSLQTLQTLKRVAIYPLSPVFPLASCMRHCI